MASFLHSCFLILFFALTLSVSPLLSLSLSYPLILLVLSLPYNMSVILYLSFFLSISLLAFSYTVCFFLSLTHFLFFLTPFLFFLLSQFYSLSSSLCLFLSKYLSRRHTHFFPPILAVNFLLFFLWPCPFLQNYTGTFSLSHTLGISVTRWVIFEISWKQICLQK